MKLVGQAMTAPDNITNPLYAVVGTMVNAHYKVLAAQAVQVDAAFK